MLDSLFRGEKYTAEELNARLKFFIGVVLGLTLFGIVFVVLYSLIFVTQPMNGMSPVDNKFFELIIPIATFLTGTLSGIMLAGDDKELRAKALDNAAKAPPPSSPTGGFSASANIGGSSFGFNVPSSRPSTPSSFTAMGQGSGSFNTPTTSFAAPGTMSSPAAGSTAMGGPTGFPVMAKPASTGPLDSDFMPERDD